MTTSGSDELRKRAAELVQEIGNLSALDQEAYLQEQSCSEELRQLVLVMLNQSSHTNTIPDSSTSSELPTQTFDERHALEQTLLTGQFPAATPWEKTETSPPEELGIDHWIEEIDRVGICTRDELQKLRDETPAQNLESWIRELISRHMLTAYQWSELQAGRGSQLVLGNYLILDKLGQGGMGMVLKAEHRRMRRKVALKVLSPAVVQSEEAVQRFQREVEAAARLTHPHIVTAYDADKSNGTVFLVMEYVPGRDLSSVVKTEGPLPLNRALNYILQAARGLEFAHANGVIHRDIKPANLLLSNDDVVRILDMGLARIDDPTGATDGQLTATGAVMGTVDYMSPEQALDTGQVDARGDIYSLGCTLYFLLTGRAVYPESTMMKRLMAHREAPIPSLVEPLLKLQSAAPPSDQDRAKLKAMAESVDGIFQSMVAKAPADRPQSIHDVVVTLEAILRGVMPARKVTARAPVAPRHDELTSVQLGSESALAPASFLSIESNATSRISQHRQRVSSDKKGTWRLAYAVVGTLAILVPGTAWVLNLSTTPSIDNPVKPGVLVETDAVVAAPLISEDPAWPRGPNDTTWEGIIPQPAKLPGVRRWQVETISNRSFASQVNWNPQGSRIAVSGGDGRMRIYTWSDSQLQLEQIVVLSASNAEPRQVHWSPDGRWLVWQDLGAYDLSLWDVEQHRWGPQLPAGPHAGIAGWNKDGSLLAAAGRDESGTGVFLWELPSGKLVRAMRGHAEIPDLVAWSADFEFLASSTYTGEVRIWQLDGTPGPKFRFQTQLLDWHPQQNLLALKGLSLKGDQGPEVQVVDVEGMVHCRFPVNPGRTNILAWTQESGQLISEHPENPGVLQVHSDQGELLRPLGGGGIPQISIRPGSDQFVVHASGMPILDGLTGEQVVLIGGNPPAAVQWSVNGKWLASVDINGVLSLWDADQELVVGSAPACQFQQSQVRWSPDVTLLSNVMYPAPAQPPYRNRLTTWTRDGRQLQRFSSSPGAVDGGWVNKGQLRIALINSEVVRLDGPSQEEPERLRLPIPQGASATYIAGSPTSDQLLLITQAPDHAQSLWLTSSKPGSTLQLIEPPENSLPSSATWSPSGKRFAVSWSNSISGAGFTEIWEPSVPSKISVILGENRSGPYMAFSPDGKTLEIGHSSYLWFSKVDSGEHLHEWTTPCGWTTAMASWSPDGVRLAVTANPTGIDISKYPPIGGGEELLIPYPVSVDWSRDDKLIAAGSVGGLVRVWELAHQNQPAWTGLSLGESDWATFSSSGKLLHHSPSALDFLYAVIEKEDKSFETLTYAEFVAKYRPPTIPSTLAP